MRHRSRFAPSSSCAPSALLARLLVLALALGPLSAAAAHFTINDSVEGEIELRHDANWEDGVVSNGIVFAPRDPGSTVVPGELASFSGGWVVRNAGDPDPGVGVIYVVDAVAPTRVKAIISANWSTEDTPGFDPASIDITVLSSPVCADLGPLPAAFDGLALIGDPGGVGIAGEFRDPVTAASVRIPSNLGMTLRSSVADMGARVPVDIKPTSCPNPLNVGSRGVLPVAILGNADLDVTEIDPETVTLEGVPALRWDLDDVAAPYGEGDCLLDCGDCHREGADGELDLSLKFDRQAIVEAIGEYEDGECRVLELRANTFGGEGIAGGDIVWIQAKGKSR
jgi:hypothetical protein